MGAVGDDRSSASEERDREILGRVAAGDVEAFEVLVERRQERLYGLCRRLLGDAEDARDAAQEVFLKVFRNAHRFRPRGRVSTWLHRIAVNHCLNRLRRRRVARFFSLGEPRGGGGGNGGGVGGGSDELDPPDDAPDPERRLADRRRWRRTRELIDRLPPGQRAVLVLAKFEGLSYRRIAEVMGITESAVESRLFRAMRRLEAARARKSEATRRTQEDAARGVS